MSLEQANFVSEKIALLNDEYNRRLVSSDLQILRPYLQYMVNLAAIKTINKESQPFALALTLSSIGIFKSDSELGIIGPAIEKILRTLSLAIDTLQPNQTNGNRKMLLDGSVILIAGMMSLAAAGSSEGTANSMYDQDAQTEINTFSLELLFEMGMHSNILEYLFQTLAEVTNHTKVNEITAVLTLATLLLDIGIISREKGPKIETLINNSKPKIVACLNTIEPIILTNPSEISTTLLIKLKQIRYSIDSNDNAQLLNTIQSLPNVCGVTIEQLEEDIQEVCKQTKMILGLLRQRGDEDLNTVTGIWQAG